MTLLKRRLVPEGFWSVALSRVQPKVSTDTSSSTSSIPPPAPIHPQSINSLRVIDQVFVKWFFDVHSDIEKIRIQLFSRSVARPRTSNWTKRLKHGWAMISKPSYPSCVRGVPNWSTRMIHPGNSKSESTISHCWKTN